MEKQTQKKNDKFSSVYGFLMVTIGCSVGVGTLWRFPYTAGTNGGALFLLAYIAVIILIGIPLLSAEMSIGFATQKTAINAYKQLAPNKPWYLAGYIHTLAAQLIYSYTVPIYANILAYIWRTATGFFNGMQPSQVADAYYSLQADYKQMLFFAAINWILIALTVRKGLQNGIESLSKFIMPALAVIMVVCIIVGLQLDGAVEGVKFLFKPNFSTFSFQSLITALGQAFFAVGIGILASMVFGSYLTNKKDNIVKHATTVCGAIIIAGIAAGLMIFPMVFAFQLEPAAGDALTMITLPNAFNAITGGRALGILFYVGFYIAAFTSAVGIMEAVVAVTMDQLHVKRSTAVAITLGFAVIIGSVAIVNKSAFSFLDSLTSNYVIVLSALLIALFVGWVWGMENFFKAANVKNKVVKIWLTASIKYISPIAILIIFLGNIFVK